MGLAGIDTRELTKGLRECGTMAGKILVEGDDRGEISEETPFEDISRFNLVAEVSVPEPILYGTGSTRIILVDCGAKANIVRRRIVGDGFLQQKISDTLDIF